MINTTGRKNVNVDKANIAPLYTFKEMDNAKLELALYKNSLAFDITGQTVKLGAKTSAGIIEQIDGFTISGNELDIVLKNSILVPSLVEIDLEFKDADGQMTSASFFVVVNSKVLNDTAVEATTEFDTFNKTVEKIEADYESLKGGLIADDKVVYFQNEINKTNSSLDAKANQVDLLTTNNELAKKSNTIEVVRKGYGTLSDFDEETRLAIQGLNPQTINAVLGDSNVLMNNIGFKVKRKNIYNYKKCTTGKFVDGNSGNLVTNASYVATDYIEVESGQSYTISPLSAFPQSHYAFYDSNKIYISGNINLTNGITILIPPTAKYIRLSLLLVGYNYVQFEKGTSVTTFEKYGFGLDETIIDENNYAEGSIKNNHLAKGSVGLTTLSNEILVFNLINIYDNTKTTDGSFINWNNGLTQVNIDFCYSDYIPIYGAMNYVQMFESHCAFYDTNKNFISGYQQGTGHKTFLTPINAKFVRVSFLKTSKNDYQLELGTISTSLKSYGYCLPETFNGLPVAVPSSDSSSVSWYKDKILCTYGDSITAQARWQQKVVDKLEFASFLNKGVSGRATYQMCVQSEIDKTTESFDVMIFMGGTNDWAQDRLIGTINDYNDTGDYNGKFYGSLNTLCKNLKTKYPTKLIMFMTPPKGCLYAKVEFLDGGFKNSLGLTVDDYAKCVVDVAKKWGIPCLDLNSNCGWNSVNLRNYITDDGGLLHPNDLGGKVISSLVIKTLSNIEPIV